MFYYLCTRCNEQFFKLENTNKISCPSCGCFKVDPKTLTYNLKEKNITIENVIHGHKDEGIVKINVTGERKKGAFQCKDCLKVYEFDCTDGLDKIHCPMCKSAKYESKSPIVSVFAGVKGVPDFTHKVLTKSEERKYRFVRNCYKSRLEVESVMQRVCALLSFIEYPKSRIDELRLSFNSILQEVDNLHEKKLDEYVKNEGIK